MNMAIVVVAIGVVAVLVSIVGIATKKDAFGDYGNGIIRYLHNSYGG